MIISTVTTIDYVPVPVEGPEEEGEDVGDNDHEQHPAEVHKNRDHGKSNNEC